MSGTDFLLVQPGVCAFSRQILSRYAQVSDFRSTFSALVWPLAVWLGTILGLSLENRLFSYIDRAFESRLRGFIRLAGGFIPIRLG